MVLMLLYYTCDYQEHVQWENLLISSYANFSVGSPQEFSIPSSPSTLSIFSIPTFNSLVSYRPKELTGKKKCAVVLSTQVVPKHCDVIVLGKYKFSAVDLTNYKTTMKKPASLFKDKGDSFVVYCDTGSTYWKASLHLPSSTSDSASS